MKSPTTMIHQIDNINLNFYIKFHFPDPHLFFFPHRPPVNDYTAKLSIFSSATNFTTEMRKRDELIDRMMSFPLPPLVL